MAGTMSIRVPCCFRVFFDYPSWWTGGSPFVPQVPGYLQTHIIHSSLTILNYKTVRAYRSSIIDIPPVHKQPKTFKFPKHSFGQKNPVTKTSSWLANRKWLYYYEANDLAYCHIYIVAYRDRKLNLDKAFILNGFPTGKIIAWPRCHRGLVRG